MSSTWLLLRASIEGLSAKRIEPGPGQPAAHPRHGRGSFSGNESDMAAWITIISALAGILAGGVVTYFTSRSQLRIEAEHAYDRTLRDMRLPQYQQLFHRTKNIPREFSEEPRRSDLLDFREQFHDWYFGEQAGGMFLSQAARDAYFALQNELQSIAGRMSADGDRVDPDQSKNLREKASVLRHQLTTDLGTAERPRNPWIIPRSIAPPQPAGAVTSSIPAQR